MYLLLNMVNLQCLESFGMIWLACRDVFPMCGEVRVRDLRFDHRWHLEKSSRLFGCEDLNLDLMYKCWDTSSDDPDIPFYEFMTLVPRWLLGRCLKHLRSRRNLDQYGSLYRNLRHISVVHLKLFRLLTKTEGEISGYIWDVLRFVLQIEFRLSQTKRGFWIPFICLPWILRRHFEWWGWVTFSISRAGHQHHQHTQRFGISGYFFFW